MKTKKIKNTKNKEFIIKGLNFKKDFLTIAGPCSIESLDQILKIAKELKSKINILRGGAFKPRTSPYDFQGLGKEGLIYLKKAADQYNLLSVSEILDPRDTKLFSECVDIIQVGARNMYNYPLLKELGKTNKPVLLKRAFSATIYEFLSSAEYIMKEGNTNIILCERGTRGFEKNLNVNSIAELKKKTNLPIIVDPSHASIDSTVIRDITRAVVAMGVNGIMLEVHTNPSESISDKEQAIDVSLFKKILKDIKKIRNLKFEP